MRLIAAGVAGFLGGVLVGVAVLYSGAVVVAVASRPSAQEP